MKMVYASHVTVENQIANAINVFVTQITMESIVKVSYLILFDLKYALK